MMQGEQRKYSKQQYVHIVFKDANMSEISTLMNLNGSNDEERCWHQINLMLTIY